MKYFILLLIITSNISLYAKGEELTLIVDLEEKHPSVIKEISKSPDPDNYMKQYELYIENYNKVIKKSVEDLWTFNSKVVFKTKSQREQLLSKGAKKYIVLCNGYFRQNPFYSIQKKETYQNYFKRVASPSGRSVLRDRLYVISGDILKIETEQDFINSGMSAMCNVPSSQEIMYNYDEVYMRNAIQILNEMCKDSWGKFAVSQKKFWLKFDQNLKPIDGNTNTIFVNTNDLKKGETLPKSLGNVSIIGFNGTERVSDLVKDKNAFILIRKDPLFIKCDQKSLGVVSISKSPVKYMLYSTTQKEVVSTFCGNTFLSKGDLETFLKIIKQ